MLYTWYMSEFCPCYILNIYEEVDVQWTKLWCLSVRSTVYPLVIAAHPAEANQFALGLSDGGVQVIEPLETEGKWGTGPPADNGAVSGVQSGPASGNQGSDQTPRWCTVVTLYGSEAVVAVLLLANWSTVPLNICMQGSLLLFARRGDGSILEFQRQIHGLWSGFGFIFVSSLWNENGGWRPHSVGLLCVWWVLGASGTRVNLILG